MVSTNGKTFLSNIQKIQVADDRILIHNLEIPGKDAANYLQQLPEEERDRICISAFNVGIHCLETTQNTQEIEFVKRQIASLLTDVEKAIALIPNTVQQELLGKLGTKEGQVLAPVQRQINEVSAVTKERVNEVKTLLSQDIDPSKETSVLGNALKTIKNLLDATRNDSVPGVLTMALKDVSAENGVLAKAVKSVVVEAVKPLADEVDRLTKEIRGKQAAQDALQQTTVKGITYEETIVAELQDWSKLTGAEVHHVGTDNNSGDILIKLTPKSIAATELSIVIEARDRESQPWSRKQISEHLNKAMAKRGANAAIFLSRTSNGLRKEIGEWAEGENDKGSWVATTHDLLILAIRFLIMQQRLTALRASQPEINAKDATASRFANALSDQIARMRTTLKRIKSINDHLTALRKSANGIEIEAETLRNELRDALTSIEDAVRDASSEI